MNPADTPTGPFVALHLAFPAAIEEELIDFCHEQSALFNGFTLLAAEGFGESASLHTVVETVLGRARRRMLVTVLPEDHVEPVIAALRAALPSPEMMYWTLPVGRFGRLS